LAPQLSCFLGDAVNGSGVHYGLLGGIFGGVGAEGSNRAGPKHFVDFEFPACFQAIIKRLHINLLSEQGVDFARG